MIRDDGRCSVDQHELVISSNLNSHNSGTGASVHQQCLSPQYPACGTDFKIIRGSAVYDEGRSGGENIMSGEFHSSSHVTHHLISVKMLIKTSYRDVPTKADGRSGKMRIYIIEPEVPEYPEAKFPGCESKSIAL